MRRLPIPCSPPPIAITDEPLLDGTVWGASTLVSPGGLEIVPAWQARPPRRARRLSAVVPLLAVVAAAALWLGRGNDVRALPEHPADAVASESAPTRALVLSAGPARQAHSGRPAR
jgi:hypothetical protein